mmetsp:Transcript_60365/g.127882  ORF Transcript_60365/g.127882 Transcript_60365/m.127882 type:complete len:205 (+) Transcript_60365:280-894(+)
MILQILGATGLAWKPLGWLLLQDVRDEGQGDWVHSRRRLNSVETFQHLVVSLHGLRSFEGWMASEELVDQHTKCPPIYRMIVAGGGDNLWSEVIRSATGCKRLPNTELGQSHVSHLQVALLVHEQVLWLQVPVDDASFVHVFESVNYAAHVVLGMLDAAVEVLADVGAVKLAAQSRFEQEVQPLRAVVSLVQGDDEWGIRHHQD